MTVTAKTQTVYTARYGGKTKTFLQERYVKQWIAKQAMKPIFDRYHAEYGESELENYHGATYTRTVWTDWREIKAWFMAWMDEGGIEFAERKLDEYFKKDWC